MRSLDVNKLVGVLKRKAPAPDSGAPAPKKGKAIPAVPVSSIAPSPGSDGSGSARGPAPGPGADRASRSSSEAPRGSAGRPIVLRGSGATRAEKGKAVVEESSKKATSPARAETAGSVRDPGSRRSGDTPRPAGSGESSEEDCFHYSGKVAKTERGLHNPDLAYLLFRSIILPQDQKLLEGQTAAQALETSFVDLLQMVHHQHKIREEFCSLKQLGVLQAESLKEAEAERKELEETNARLTAEVESHRGREAALKEAILKDREMATEKARLLELRIAGLAANEERAKSAFQNALAEKEKILAEQGRMISEAEAKAVAAYTDSDEFEMVLTEAAAPAFALGFEECKRRLASQLPRLHLERLRVEDDPLETGNLRLDAPEEDRPAEPVVEGADEVAPSSATEAVGETADPAIHIPNVSTV